MKISMELSESDLEHFRNRLQKSIEASSHLSAEQITQAAESLLEEVRSSEVPTFICDRLEKITTMISMVHDDGWGLPDDEKNRVLSALAYFSDPEDIIPDDIPGLGFLDDAIMVELLVRELRHEIQAYDDFSKFRENGANSRGLKLTEELDRATWLEARRKQLHARIRNRRKNERSRKRGSGSRGSSFSLW